MSIIKVNSEIGKLRKVMLHTPGYELDRITPDELQEVLFEDIPWMTRMREEHAGFAGKLEENGVEVLYVENYLKDVLAIEDARKEMIEDIISSEVAYDEITTGALSEYLLSKNDEELATCIISGLSEKDIQFKKKSASKYLEHRYPYYYKPLPNFYFTRDISACIKNGVAPSKMKTDIRSRESKIMRLIFKYHKDFENSPIYYDNKKEKMSIEGGDVLVLSSDTVAVGFSERTSLQAIDKLASNLFSSNSGIEKVLAIKIPHVRAFMHLDTVFTMVDYDKFVIFPNIISSIEVATITKGKNNTLEYEMEDNLKIALEKALNIDHIDLILSGGSSPITAAREQWNDSTNTLAISPGVVVTYNRNEVSNEILEKKGIKVLQVEGSELVRGRGGPRCMSMPIARDDL